MKSPLIVIFLMFAAPILMLSLSLKTISLLAKLAIELSGYFKPLPPVMSFGILVCTAVVQYQWSNVL